MNSFWLGSGPTSRLVIPSGRFFNSVMLLKWKRKRCVVCKLPVRGSVDRIALSILCARCCKKVQSESVLKYTSEETAIQLYDCQQMDLLLLSSSHVRHRGEERNRYCKRVFLTAEVAHLHQAVQEKREQTAENKEFRKRMIKRKQLLLKKLKIGIHEFSRKEDRILWIAILGDYLKREKPRTTMDIIQQRIAVLPRVREFRRRCLGVHPQAAFDFCVTYPDAGLMEFQELKDKTRRVFWIEGQRIVQHLDEFDLHSMRGTHLDPYTFLFAECKIDFRSQ